MSGLGEALENRAIYTTLLSLVKKGRLTKEDAAEEANMSVTEFEELLLEGAPEKN